MTADLERAVRAYRRAQQVVSDRRADLAGEIARAAADGTRQVDIVRITGYTREHIRRIVADANEN